MVIVQGPVPVQAPLQLANKDPAAGAAFSVTTVPVGNGALQLVPQLIPPGMLVTVPPPVPAVFTVSVVVVGGGAGLNDAVIVLGPVIVTTHGPVPLHPPPLHPPNVELPVAAAVRVTWVPLAKLALQVAPQVMPGGVLVTVPLPAPVFVTVSTTVGAGVNSAVTVRSTFMTTVQGPVPLQAPLHPAKVAPPKGAAVSVTGLPIGKLAKQLPPQSIPLGSLVTVPAPVPDLLTVKRAVFAPAVKMAATVALPVTIQGPVPEQAPFHPANTEPGAAAAVNPTDAPASN
jgi:hypothetical protein